MADSATAVTERVQQAPGRWTPWLALAVALAGVASYVVSMVLPYYVNGLDRSGWRTSPGVATTRSRGPTTLRWLATPLGSTLIVWWFD